MESYALNSLSKDMRWYIIFTISNHEKSINNNLKKRGINTFLPLRKEVRQWSDRKKKVEVPCFPNYLFVNLSANERYKILEVPGVVRFLDSNQNPTTISEEEIDFIRKVSQGEGFNLTLEEFNEGDSVIITSGPLQNLRGTLVNIKGKERLLVEIRSINKNVIVDIATHSIQKDDDLKYAS